MIEETVIYVANILRKTIVVIKEEEEETLQSSEDWLNKNSLQLFVTWSWIVCYSRHRCVVPAWLSHNLLLLMLESIVFSYRAQNISIVTSIIKIYN